MIVLIIHNVPSHSSNPKDTCSQTTDKNAADNGSTLANILVSEALIYVRLSK